MATAGSAPSNRLSTKASAALARSACASGAARLPDGAGEPGREREHQRGDARDGPAVATREAAEHVGAGAFARAHRLAALMTLDVALQVADGFVAARRLRTQAFRDDRIEVAGDQARRYRRVGAPGSDAARQPRRALEQSPRRVRVREAAGTPGPLAGQQFEQQHAERVDVGRGRHRLAAELFGRRVVRRERCDGEFGRAWRGRVEQLRDAEVEQLHGAGGVDEDVGRLQVAVDDQVAVRIGDGLADLSEQRESFGERRAPFVAVVAQRTSFDEFHHRVRTALRRRAAVEQARDARMVEPREDVALGMEAAALAVGLAAQQLQRDAMLERAVGALRRVHLAHAAAADQRADAPRTEPRSRRERRCGRRGRNEFGCGGRRVEHALRIVRTQQIVEFAPQLGVVAAGVREECRPFTRRQRGGGLEQVFDTLPALAMHGVRPHGHAGFCLRHRAMQPDFTGAAARRDRRRTMTASRAAGERGANSGRGRRRRAGARGGADTAAEIRTVTPARARDR
ncbi:MAG TPA: hypothetical protein VGC30_04575 [Dokdonella sp.]